MNKALKIALLTYSTKPRGGVIHTMELAEALHRLGHQVCIFALDKDGQGLCRPVACEYRLIPTQPAPTDIDRVVQQRIQEYVDYFTQRPLDYDIIHAQDCISANALALLRNRITIPNIVRTVHHVDDYQSAYLEDCQAKGVLQPNLCLCVSQHWQQEIKQQYGVNALQVFNGVDNQRFSSDMNGAETALKEKLGFKGFPRFLTIGGVEPRKNSIRLLQAFAGVLAHQPAAQLAIAGGISLFNYDAYRHDFFTEAKRLGIEVGRSLLLTGPLPDPDMPTLYRTAHAFVFPSVVEGWGLVVMEAIASGLPVITSDRPPFTEFLSNQQALLIDPLQPEALTQAMLKIIQPAIAQPLIQASQLVCQQYTWENSAKMHLKYYRNLLEESQI
ncbi:MAG: MSMEG_0565 family glycosyltransferase [Pseudanabaenales cyanobacterium]|nr:MSMEG_0565 family glycosyltransferase [Pseudanabaenales cyanobacterium]